jgi:hypothetical protein
MCKNVPFEKISKIYIAFCTSKSMSAIKILLVSITFLVLAGFSNALIDNLASCTETDRTIDFTYVNGSTGSILRNECGPYWKDSTVVGHLSHYCIGNTMVGGVFDFTPSCPNYIPNVISCTSNIESITIIFSNGTTEIKPQSKCGRLGGDLYNHVKINYECIRGVEVLKDFKFQPFCEDKENQEVPEFGIIGTILAIIGGIIIFAVRKK